MSCADVRQRLLASERPDRPGPEESRHLTGCPACHAWLRRLVRLERQITELRVPDCPVPAALLEHVAQPPAPLVRPPLQPSAQVRSVREVGRQKLALAFSLAATLTLFTLAWWAWPPRPASSPYRERIQEVLRSSRTPQQRVEVLTELAGDLLDEARDLGDRPEQVAALARDFKELVETDLFDQASVVPEADRARMLPGIADRLLRANSEAAQLATTWKVRHADSARSMNQIADSAREAERRLRLLVPARA